MFKKFAVVMVVMVAMFMVAGIAMAQDTVKTTETVTATTVTETVAAPVVVGNKVCPVTGMAIAEADMGKNTVEFEGKVYNLCSAECKDKFLADPKASIAKVEEEMAKAVVPAEAK